ncbi:DNA-binding transcriptional LysR family regulator [Arthrobacter bambusae]|uniref:DNA-binding transcriptional LysR family regulator n=1 Tax=Arthrobacter bambusae TaxID=1338426 RepID=A0ABV2P0Y9_9MICC
MNLNRVDLNLLVALDALLTEQSVTKAAERLQVGQSAMSSTLGRLRKLFGDPILVRNGRNLMPTPFARSLSDPLREALGRVESLLTTKSEFNPATDHRDFSVTSNDYVAAVFLRPLLVRLAAEAPNVKLHFQPVQDDFAKRLRQGETDILIMPKEVFLEYVDFPNELLFSDRYVCAVDANNPDVGTSITIGEFSAQPYLAVNVGHLPTSAEMQLDAQGVIRNTQITTQMFMLAPFLLRETRLLTLIQERLGLTLRTNANLRLLEPPMPLQPVNMVMLWAEQHADDSGHQWLRRQLMSLSSELFPDASI